MTVFVRIHPFGVLCTIVFVVQDISVFWIRSKRKSDNFPFETLLSLKLIKLRYIWQIFNLDSLKNSSNENTLFFQRGITFFPRFHKSLYSHEQHIQVFRIFTTRVHRTIVRRGSSRVFYPRRVCLVVAFTIVECHADERCCVDWYIRRAETSWSSVQRWRPEAFVVVTDSPTVFQYFPRAPRTALVAFISRVRIKPGVITWTLGARSRHFPRAQRQPRGLLNHHRL